MQALRLGDTDAALALLMQRMEGAENPRDLPAAYNDMALALRLAGRPDEAQAYFHRAIAESERQGTPQSLEVAGALSGLADIYWAAGRLDAIEPLYQRAMGIWDAQLGPDNPRSQAVTVRYARLLERQAQKNTAPTSPKPGPEDSTAAQNTGPSPKPSSQPAKTSAEASSQPPDSNKPVRMIRVFLSDNFEPVNFVAGANPQPPIKTACPVQARRDYPGA